MVRRRRIFFGVLTVIPAVLLLAGMGSHLMRNESFANSIDEYLRLRSILRRSVEMFFTYIAMSARANWRNVPDAIRPITARGWFLGRWLATFLIIDGPQMVRNFGHS